METKSSSSQKPEPVVFSGEAGEYFRIWAVNMALTIVTLGIYSAWATVRKRRYFYSHTALAGGTFDFHANPRAILFGRVIAVALLGSYFLASYIHPVAPPIIMLFIIAIVPWLIVRSRIFRLRNTSFRGIRFNFQRNYKDAFKAYYGGFLLTVVTLGFAAATAVYWRNRFSVANSAFGKTPFSFLGEHSEYVAIVWKSIGLTVLVVFVYFLMLMFLSPIPLQEAPDAAPNIGSLIAQVVITVPLFLLYAAVGVYYQVRLRNYVWNTAQLGEIKFLSDLKVGRMCLIYLTNLLAIVLSLGLLTPWAQIRLARYRAEQVHVQLADDWQQFLADNTSAGSALGDEIGDAFDMEVDVGI